MGLFDLLKKLGRKDESDGGKVKINPFVQKDVDPFQFWEKQKKLGDGSYGEIYRGVRKDTQQQAAIKQISIDGDDDLQDYMVEIDILLKCKHSKVVGLYEAFLFDSTLWLCLELCSVGALDSIMIELDKGLTERQIQYVGFNLCEALEYLHSCGVIHRDLKAGNILVTSSADIKLADFGVSALGDGPSVKRHSFIGSNYWMAPEVMVCETYSEIPYGTKVDVWSFGITLIELAQMLPPHHTMQPMRVAIRVLKGDPPKLERPRNWSTDFSDFLSKCLTKTAESRASISDLRTHSFLSKVDDSFKKDVRDLISEFQATPEVEVQEVEDPDVGLRNRDSVYSLSALDAAGDAEVEKSSMENSMNETEMSMIYDESLTSSIQEQTKTTSEPESTAVFKVPGTPPITLRHEVKPPEKQASLDEDSKNPSVLSSSDVPPPNEFASSPVRKLSHSKSLDSVLQQDIEPTSTTDKTTVHPAVVLRGNSETENRPKKKPPAPLPKRFSSKNLAESNQERMKKANSTSSIINEIPQQLNKSIDFDVVPPSPVFPSTKKQAPPPPASDDKQQTSIPHVEVLPPQSSQEVVESQPNIDQLMPAATNLRAVSYLGEVNSARSSISSDTIESDPGGQQQKLSDVAEDVMMVETADDTVDDIIDEVVLDDSHDPSVPAVVLDVMQEAFTSVTDIDEMISSSFDLAIAGHEDGSSKTTTTTTTNNNTDTTTPIVEHRPSKSEDKTSSTTTTTVNGAVHHQHSSSSQVNNSNSQTAPHNNPPIISSGYGSVSAKVTKDYSKVSLDSMSSSSSSIQQQQQPSTSQAESSKSTVADNTDLEATKRPLVVRRKNEDRFNSVLIKKKRVYTDESGRQVVSTTTRTVRKGDENKMHDHIINRRQELREQKLLNKQHQKQDLDFKLKAQSEDSAMDNRFRAERAQIQRDQEFTIQKLRKEYDDEERVQKAHLDRVMKSETGRWKQHHERSLREFRDNQKKRRKQMDLGSGKDSVRSQAKEQEREDERQYVRRLMAERVEKEAQMHLEYQQKCDERKLKLTSDLQHHERRFFHESNEQKERHIYERFELKAQHLQEYFTLKKAQAIQKHERELDQIRRYYETKRQTLLESHTQERKLKPKLLRKEKVTREKMFKASLDLRQPPMTDTEIQLKIREFDENENARMAAETKRMEKKLEQIRDDFERRVARIDSEVRTAQNEKRQMIIVMETEQRKDLDVQRKGELSEFHTKRAMDTNILESRLEHEMREAKEEVRRLSENHQIQMNETLRQAGVNSRSMTVA